jgi:hypothetical protein
MAIIGSLAGIVIALLAATTIIIFIAVIAATILVTGAVHTEERRKTLTGPAPGTATRLARRLLAFPEGGTNRHLRPAGARTVPVPVPPPTANGQPSPAIPDWESLEPLTTPTLASR